MTWFFVFLLGLCIGSFVNVLIDRLPRGKSVLWSRSQCDYCRKTLRWWELIPVVSYVYLGGTCSRCHKPLSLQYPSIELATGLGLVLIPYVYWIVFLTLFVIFVADLKYQIIPDSMIVIGVIGAIGVIGVKTNNMLAGLGAALFFGLLYLVTRGRGMGLGDVKLSFLLGFILGVPNIVIALYAAFLTGAAAGVILILTGSKKLKSKIAFGPFLIIGYAIATFYSETILTWVYPH